MTEFETRVLKKGDVIYRQGDYETCLYEILYGGVTLYQNYGTADQVLIKELAPGTYLGEMEVVEARPRTTTAIATEKTELKIITGEDFSMLLREKPALVLSLMQQMSARIRELTRLYNDACRVVSEAMDAEDAGREKSEKLQEERRSLSNVYRALLGRR